MTTVFEVFEYKYDVVEIVAQQNYSQENFFAETHEVITDFTKSDRVLKKLEENLGKQGISQLMMVYFSERKDLERLTQITQLKFFEISLWGNPKFRRTIFCVFW